MVISIILREIYFKNRAYVSGMSMKMHSSMLCLLDNSPNQKLKQKHETIHANMSTSLTNIPKFITWIKFSFTCWFN